MSYNLSNRSKGKLEGVHPDLVAIVERAITITSQDFSVLEGLRSFERQEALVARGSSTTMNSRHIMAPNGYGHAVDIAPFPLSWDWDKFYPLADAMKLAAKQLGTTLEWGGDWTSFKDGPHFQLPWGTYNGKR
jgi:peptidoglycan L-alanyl-D-glutamate endopeptidase CwlK